ncbi:transporter [Rhodococcus oxybenzonivorans]|uniref:Transporter n=1 Tax=Rhodococcus oxybenzonivorans TaxID=1990687 RepID=A0A2S2C0A3_9NOCA|nr:MULTISPECIES: transporter [Rhodococcus]AWK74300.1 transporter [Rhodococcus oxybenzonivorans]QTJ67925.1 transporter [Rhodococcus sp. ZPP]
MRDILFAAADIWMIVVGFICGVKFIRRHHNYLIGLEWIIMAVSGTNFLLYGVTKSGTDSPMYHIAFFLDAFSRSIGFTLILVLGLLVVTHRYKPTLGVEVGAFALAAILGFFLSEYAEEIGTPGKVFFLITALATSGFLCYFAWRLWELGERAHAAWAACATALNVVVASIYDFWRIPGDDANHTLFYTLALFTWGLAMLVIYRAYTAFAAHNKRDDAHLDPTAASPVRGAEIA